ncbi:unnamed protein product, partial [Rangifer tarandus platyrhynchus]
ESMFLPLPYVKVTLRVPVPVASCDSQTHERPTFSPSPWGHGHPSQPPTCFHGPESSMGTGGWGWGRWLGERQQEESGKQ